ncbi:UNVERIFIED_CONTAM: hypothetical protein RMT77_007755 [Armadillidium vulgare]
MSRVLFICSLNHMTMKIVLKMHIQSNFASIRKVLTDEKGSENEAFVLFNSLNGSQEARDSLHGSVLDGKNLVVNLSTFFNKNMKNSTLVALDIPYHLKKGICK